MHNIIDTVRAGIAAGMSNSEIIEAATAQEFEDAAYGPSDADALCYRFGQELHGRNDAGEWIGLM